MNKTQVNTKQLFARQEKADFRKFWKKITKKEKSGLNFEMLYFLIIFFLFY